MLQDTSRVLNIMAAPKCGTTPLHDAAGNNHLKVVELLVTAGGEFSSNLFPCFGFFFSFTQTKIHQNLFSEPVGIQPDY